MPGNLSFILFRDQSDQSSRHVLIFNTWIFGSLSDDWSFEIMTPDLTCYGMSLDS
jgi:hypothetical protein